MPGVGLTCEGPSYPNGIKGIAITVALSIVVLGSTAGVRDAMALAGPGAKVLALAALAIVFVQLWLMLRSRTRIDALGVHQDGPWKRSVALEDIAHAAVLRIRGLEWILTPRLLVRTRAGTRLTFHAGDELVVAAFERLAAGACADHQSL